jgi:hypothetical protein
MPTIYVPEGGQTEQLKRENHKAKEAERREAEEAAAGSAQQQKRLRKYFIA